MILKSLFRRCERWNPVHPTYGAFWGIGVGIGCGVGWGPGFGPDVIGYVGAGCGAGFNVGFTFLGVGIGLPSNYHFTVPHSGFKIDSLTEGMKDLPDVNAALASHAKHVFGCVQRVGGRFFPRDRGMPK